MAVLDMIRKQRSKVHGRDANIKEFDFDNEEEDYYDGFDNREDDNSRWELDTKEVLEAYEHSLRSERQDENGIWSRDDSAKAKLNDTGVFDTISDLRSIMHKGTYLGNINHDYAVDQTKAEARAYMKKLVYNYQLWDIDKSQFESLVLSFAREVHLALTRPIGDRERGHRDKRIKIQEQMKNDLDVKERVTLN